MSEVNTKDWKSKKESTSFLGIKILILCRKIGGKYFVNFIIAIIALVVYLGNKKVRVQCKQYYSYLLSTAAYKNKKVNSYSVYGHLYTFCISIFNKILTWSKDVTFKDVDDYENSHQKMLEVASKKEGALIIGAHIGNIEMLRALNNQLTQKVINIFISTENSKKFMQLLKNTNEASSLNLIISDSIGPELAIDLKQRIDNGEWIVILADRLLNEDTRSVEVDFLQHKALFPQGPWILAYIMQANVYSLYGLTVNGKPTIFFNEWGKVVLRRGKREEDIALYAQKFADEMADYLFLAPKDWFNIYDFWIADQNETIENK